jgi:autonomous glycyl radical cofactor GrcA
VTDAYHRRLRTAQAVQLVPPAGDPIEAMLLDISRSGAFLELASPIDVGVAIEVRLPASAPETTPLQLAGTVVRKGKMDKALRHPVLEHLIVRVPGVGIRFAPLAPEQSTQLLQFLALLEER